MKKAHIVPVDKCVLFSGGDEIELYSRGASTSFGFRGASRLTCACGTRLAGAALLASLESKLSDSASLRYLRRAHCVSPSQRGKSRRRSHKNKRDTRNWVSLLFGGKEASMFELNNIDNSLVMCYIYDKFRTKKVIYTI